MVGVCLPATASLSWPGCQDLFLNRGSKLWPSSLFVELEANSQESPNLVCLLKTELLSTSTNSMLESRPAA